MLSGGTREDSSFVSLSRRLDGRHTMIYHRTDGVIEENRQRVSAGLFLKHCFIEANTSGSSSDSFECHNVATGRSNAVGVVKPINRRVNCLDGQTIDAFLLIFQTTNAPLANQELC